MTGLVTDLWVNTDEWIPSAGISGSEKLDASQAELPNLQPRSQQEASGIDRYNQQEIKRVHFAVGLWTVCPSHPDNHLLKGSGSDSNPRNYQESSYPCSSISISRILDTSDLSWRQELGLWSPAYNTFRIIDNIRICALFAISSLALMIISTFLATLGHCVRGHKMLLASGLYALGGLLLGCCLLILVCTISEEFGPANSRTKLSSASSSSVLKSESRSYLQRQNSPISSGQTKEEYTSGDQYSYGWSFILATLGFLGSELSALLCLAAFLNRFDSEEDFIKMLPGMERRLTEHMMVHQQASEIASGRSLQEVPLLKGSFGHHSATTGNSSSQESLYGASSSQQGQNKILTSGSLHSLRAKQIPVTAEIVPMPLTERGDQRGGSVILANSASSGAITSSSFMPENSLGCLGHRSAQPPPTSNLENGYVQHMMSVNSRLSSSPVLVDTHVRSTMPRNMHVNGNEWNSGCEDPSTPPPPPPPHGSAMALHGSHGNSLSATLPVKKKSVTIGTFTTVVEPFEIDHSNHHHDHVNDSMMTSAV
eukprot:13227.XXX_613201_594038_1 [CDS] Oithona nana genome sequencing.